MRALAAAIGIAGLLSGCGGEPASRSRMSPAVPPPSVPGRSEEFERMKVPPGQLARAIPIGEAWPPEQGPVYRSLCLRCHAVSQTSFAVADWRESLHARAGVGCAACHGTHEDEFVTRPGPERCLLCHAQQVEEFLASRHGPEPSPGLRCVSCHEAHATDRALARTTGACTGCHLESDHVQGFAGSRMGEARAADPRIADGRMRAPDCAHCHMPPSAGTQAAADFRNDRVTLHDPARTVARDARDPKQLARETIEFMLPLCLGCHSERNARHRLERSDPVILHWTPVGMPREVRQRPPGRVAPLPGPRARENRP